MPSLRSHFPAFYRFTAFLALLALLTPMATLLVHHPAAAHALVHICGIDQKTQDGHDKTPTHKTPSCPVCQSLHWLGGGFVPPNPVVIAATVLPHATFIASLPDILVPFNSAPHPSPLSILKPKVLRPSPRFQCLCEEPCLKIP